MNPSCSDAGVCCVMSAILHDVFNEFYNTFQRIGFRKQSRRSSSRKEARKQPPIPCGGRPFHALVRSSGQSCGRQQRVGACTVCLHLIQSSHERIDKDALSEDAVLEVGAAPGDAVASAPNDDLVTLTLGLDARTAVLCAIFRAVGKIKEALRRNRHVRPLLRNRLRILPARRRRVRLRLLLCMPMRVVNGGGLRFELRSEAALLRRGRLLARRVLDCSARRRQ